MKFLKLLISKIWDKYFHKKKPQLPEGVAVERVNKTTFKVTSDKDLSPTEIIDLVKKFGGNQ